MGSLAGWLSFPLLLLRGLLLPPCFHLWRAGLTARAWELKLAPGRACTRLVNLDL